MSSLEGVIKTIGVATGLAATTILGASYHTIDQRNTMRANVKDSVEAALPAVKERMGTVTGIQGPLPTGYFSEDSPVAGKADATLNQDADSLHINTRTPHTLFRKENDDYLRRLTRRAWDAPEPEGSVLGTIYHEASHVRFAQRFDTLATDNFYLTIKENKPELAMLNEGVARWIEHRMGEREEPDSAAVTNPERLPLKLVRGDRNVYTGGHTLVEPVLDSLGYKDGVTRMITRPLPSREELTSPGSYHKRILSDTTRHR